MRDRTNVEPSNDVLRGIQGAPRAGATHSGARHEEAVVRAVVLEGIGDPEQLVVRDVPEPTADDRHAIVDVRACGINFADVLVRRGMYPQMPELPTVLGSELAGDLDGDRVMGFVLSGGGGYAERAAVDRRWLLPLPAGASYAEGASFPMAFLTAWIPLTELARIAFGARVLVTAAAGAVGTAAIQIVKALNGAPIAAVGSEEKLELTRSLGAVEAVTYGSLGDVEQVDVAFDLVGGDVFQTCLSLLKPMGTAIAVGYAGGLWQDVSPTWLVGRNIGVHGFYLGRLIGRSPDLVRRAAGDVVRLWEGGAVRPVVGAEYPLEEAAAAHRLIEERKSTGKVVLVP
jgi:NADPH2:quinone reductase